ncbi:unnamed protein product [Sphagnum troendelagicum]|uniref:Uncharacterized protein n=1 Tax=Sphagnum troendelagicum TaxID=128251 RepID=A0ABP0UH56_9BRYO
MAPKVRETKLRRNKMNETELNETYAKEQAHCGVIELMELARDADLDAFKVKWKGLDWNSGVAFESTDVKFGEQETALAKLYAKQVQALAKLYAKQDAALAKSCEGDEEQARAVAKLWEDDEQAGAVAKLFEGEDQARKLAKLYEDEIG